MKSADKNQYGIMTTVHRWAGLLYHINCHIFLFRFASLPDYFRFFLNLLVMDKTQMLNFFKY